MVEDAPEIDLTQKMASGGAAGQSDESRRVSDAPRAESTSDRATRVHADAAKKPAIVLNRSRPELVARFMDLYA